MGWARRWGGALSPTTHNNERQNMSTITPDALRVERRHMPDATPEYTAITAEGITTVLLSPPLGEDYWSYRVRVAEGQAVVGFGKFGTIGIGFAVEGTDWNTNLPYTQDAERIRQHIWDNRAPLADTVDSAALVVRAIELIQAAVAEDGGPQ